MQGYSRRQLKQDKFAEAAQGAVHWTTEHRSNIIWAVIIVLVAAGATIGFLAWNSHQTEKANLAFNNAVRTYSAPLRPPGTPANENMQSFTSLAERNQAAQKQFKAVADQFPHTKPGKLARYMAATAALQAGDSTAEQQLKDVAESGDANVAAMAKLALANIYRSSNRQAEAVKIYKDLSDHPTDTVPKTRAQLEMASMYEATDPREAASIYQQIQKDNPQSAAAQIAAAKLAKAGKQ